MKQNLQSDETMLTTDQALDWIESEHGYRPRFRTFWKWTSKGIGGRVLPKRKFGGRILIRLDDLRAFCEHISEVPSDQAAIA